MARLLRKYDMTDKTRTWEIPADNDEARNICANAIYKAVLEAQGGYVVRIGPQSKTDRQRNTFHTQCTEIGLDLGYTMGQIKELVKADFYGYDEVKVGNKYRRILKSTEDSDREEYSRLIEFLPIWRSENGI